MPGLHVHIAKARRLAAPSGPGPKPQGVNPELANMECPGD